MGLEIVTRKGLAILERLGTFSHTLIDLEFNQVVDDLTNHAYVTKP